MLKEGDEYGNIWYYNNTRSIYCNCILYNLVFEKEDTMIELLPHQLVCLREAEEALSKGKTHLLIHAGFGLGKTYISLSILESILINSEKDNISVLILCAPTKVDDWVNAYCKYFDTDELNENDTVMSIDTIWRRPPKKYDVVIIDESQFFKVKPSLKMKSNRAEFIHKHYWNNEYLIMLSGTPFYKWEDSYGQYCMLDSKCNGVLSRKEFAAEYLIIGQNTWLQPRPFLEIQGCKNTDKLEK